jgi:hypothetical protein
MAMFGIPGIIIYPSIFDHKERLAPLEFYRDIPFQKNARITALQYKSARFLKSIIANGLRSIQ